jgi:nucleotide-binding universal stress UspA family protein
MRETQRNTQPVVVGVDDSDSARDAALWAADLAVLWKAPVRLVHVVNRAGSLSPHSEPDWLLGLAAAVAHLGVTSVATEIRYGGVGDQMLAEARDARLLVLGSYGEEGWSGLLVGTNALRLVEGCPCPLAVVRGASPGLAPPRGGPVVVGVDGTSASIHALRFAADLASRSEHRRLIAVHTWSEVVTDPSGHPYRLDEDTDKLARRAEELLESYLAPVLAAHPGLVIERHVRQDTPLRGLHEHAGNAWLLVVGQRRPLAQSGIRAGSTSRGLVEFAPCPVAVITPPAIPPRGGNS